MLHACEHSHTCIYYPPPPDAETVVGESVVVIKKLLQLQPKENKDLIIQVAKLTDKVTVCEHTHTQPPPTFICYSFYPECMYLSTLFNAH